MIFHASIPADDPKHVASVLAEIRGTEYFPFVFPDSYVVISANEWGSLLEVCKRGDEQVPAPVEVGLRRNPSPSRYNEVHLLIGSRLGFDDIFAIAEREQWIARSCDRAIFQLVELWIENKFLVEVVTAAQIERYRRFYSSVENWREAIKHTPMPIPQFGCTEKWLEGPVRP